MNFLSLLNQFLILEKEMKTNDATAQTSHISVNNSDRQELETFNRRRAARGLLPVTQEEFNELLMKIAGMSLFSLSTPTVH
jgi:hypothetical protein